MDVIEEVKSRLSIEDVVGQRVELKRSGSSLKGLCPFHEEKTPSFYVSPSRGTYHCFGCGKGGDIFSFVMESDHLSFKDALDRLAGKAGVRVPERPSSSSSLKGKLHEINDVAASYFQSILSEPAGRAAVVYLKERGFEDEGVDTFQLGATPERRDGLLNHLRSAGYDDRLMRAAGLAVEDEIGGSLRDRFRQRLMFPIRDASGKAIGFGGRLWRNDDISGGPPKYLNSPQTDVFDKSTVLYGLHLAEVSIREAGQAVLVEGYLDAIRAHLNGYRNVVASLGTAVTPRQLDLLARHTSRVVVALDPDPAGQGAAARACLTALAEVSKRIHSGPHGPGRSFELLIARLPSEGGDPDSLIQTSPDEWEKALAAATPAFDFFFDQTLNAIDKSSTSWRQEAVDRVLPVIQSFASRTGWQAAWIERLARETMIDPRVLQRSLSASPKPRRSPRQTRQEQGGEVTSQTTSRGLSADPARGIEAALLGLLLQMVLLPKDVVDMVELSAFHDKRHESIYDSLLKWQSTGNHDFDMFEETLDDDGVAYARSLRATSPPLQDEQKLITAVTYHLARLHYFALQSQLREVSHLVGEVAAEDRGEPLAQLNEVMKERREVEQLLERLSREMVRASPSLEAV